MRPAFEIILLIGAALLLVSILASKLSARLGVPALLLFLAVGMLAGADGPGGLYFDDPWLTQSLGVLALVLILFAGGLDTEWRVLRPVLAPGLALATLGVALTAALVGAFAVYVLGFPWLEALLLGAIVSSTDAAAVFSLLRSRETRLAGRLEPLIELESGSNDPMAVVLTLGLIQLITQPALSPLALVPFFLQQMALGLALGDGLGRLMVLALNRLRLEVQGLYPALTLALVLFGYGATTALGGNGFLAVYVAGLRLGKQDVIHKKSLRQFHDALAWIMQITMFLTLGLQVFPSRLPPIAWGGLWMAAFLMLAARPVSVFLALAFTRFSAREKVMIAWAGLRGAAPIILATFPYLAGLPRADLIFHLVFFVVLASVLLQGTTLSLVARWLKVEATRPAPEAVLDHERPHSLEDHLERVPLLPGSDAAGRQIVDLGLPPGVLVVLIARDGHYHVPSGGTVLQPGDELLALADGPGLTTLRQIAAPAAAAQEARDADTSP